MELRRIDAFLLKILYLIAVLIVVFQALGQGSITSMLFMMTFPVTVLLWIRSVRNTITGMDLLVLITIALAFFAVLVNAIAAKTSLSFSYLRKVIMFAMSLLFMQVAYRMRVEKDIISFVNNMVNFLTIFLIAMYFLQNAQMHLFGGRVTRYLTFRFSNPNVAAMFLTCLYMLELYRLFRPEKWYWKLLHIVMAVFLAWFIFESQSRNSLLVVSLFTAVCAWLVFKSGKHLYMPKGLAAVISIFPALFVGGYLALINMSWVQELLSFITGTGKGLDSRVLIWQQALEYLIQSPLIGAYGQISEGTGAFQMHNTHLDIACSYGIPVLIMVCVLLRNYIYQRGRRYSDKESYIYILGFACAVMLGIGEAALFSGGLGIYIFVGTFLLFVNRGDAY